MTVLVADVGGTHCRFALAEQERGALVLSAFHTYASASQPALEPLLYDYLDRTGAAPTMAALAVAGPVEDGVCTATNLPWVVDAARLTESLASRGHALRVEVLNDFEAVAWGVREVPTELRHTLQAGRHDPTGPIAVLGAGTGLGEALAVPIGHGLRVLPTEGGHTDLAPRNAFEDALLVHLRARFPEHVSYERVLSGRGLGALFEHVLALTGDERTASHEAVLLSDDPAREVIARRAVDPVCARTVEAFVDLLGAEAGNLALKSIPTGGLFVAGGIAPRIHDVVERRLLPALLAKGRMRRVLERVPVHLVLDGHVGLRGAAAYARYAR
ncbi:MAG: glucokinase [Sandaracinaceae bacterium]